MHRKQRHEAAEDWEVQAGAHLGKSSSARAVVYPAGHSGRGQTSRLSFGMGMFHKYTRGQGGRRALP
eukprot:2715502-Pyramimonas_sp.AAC.1